MKHVLERNLEALLKQAYHPVRPRAEFREALLAKVHTALEEQVSGIRFTEGPTGKARWSRAPRHWRPALAIAAALLVAVPLFTLAALEIFRLTGSGPARDVPGAIDSGAVVEVSVVDKHGLEADHGAAGRRSLVAPEEGLPERGRADFEGTGRLPSGVLAGHVVDAETGQPIPRFVLWRRPERNLPEVSEAIPLEVEDASGLFRLESVAPDRYALFVEAPGHAIWKLRGALVEDGLETHHEVRLQRGSAVQGHVIDSATGAPVSGARVYAEFDLPYGLMEIAGRYLPRWPAASTLTDANGAYLLEHLSPGQHQLRASHPDHAPAWSATFVLPASGSDAPFEVSHLMLDTGGRLEGRVQHADGTPWAGVEVIASLIAMERPQPVLAYGIAFTDRDGAYSIERLPEGYYVAMHQGDSPGGSTTASNLLQTTVRRDATTELNFVPQQGGSELAGVLTDATDRPLAGYTVYLNPDVLGAAFQNWIATPVKTGGRYRFQNVAPGTYDLFVAEKADRMIWIRRLEVAGPGEVQLDLHLPQGSVSGTVSTTEGPVTSALVILMRWDVEWSCWAFHGTSGTELDGTYAFAGLGPGRYRLSAIGRSPSRGSTNPPAFEVRQEDEQQDIVLEAGGSLVLEVRDESGDPVAGAVVRLLDAAGLELAYHAEATTDTAGQQRIPSLAQGTWTVIVAREGMQENRVSVQVLVGEESQLWVTLRSSSGR